jgi:twinkle protein
MVARIPDPAKPFVVADSVAEIQAKAGINLGKARLSAGRSVKARCPACGGGKTREDSLSVKLDDDGRGLAWHCFRATCQGGRLLPGSGRIAEAQGNRDQRDDRDDTPIERPVVRPKVEPIEERRRPPGLLAWFRLRGISEETVEA